MSSPSVARCLPRPPCGSGSFLFRKRLYKASDQSCTSENSWDYIKAGYYAKDQVGIASRALIDRGSWRSRDRSLI
jgi:hypothetical protein